MNDLIFAGVIVLFFIVSAFTPASARNFRRTQWKQSLSGSSLCLLFVYLCSWP